MRVPLSVVLFALATLTFADRVITIPRGGKIPFGTIRGEYMFEPSQPTSSISFLGVGLTTFVDAEIETDQMRGEKKFTQLDLDFNLNSPLAGFAPGISVGLLDATDQSPEGRRGYVAVSFQDTGGPNNATVETTVGAFFGKTSHMFVGLSLPVSDQFRFLAEDDGFRVSAGAEWRSGSGPYFRFVFREHSTLLSVGSTTHF